MQSVILSFHSVSSKCLLCVWNHLGFGESREIRTGVYLEEFTAEKGRLIDKVTGRKFMQ